jgi:hypothetical protein
MNEVLGACAGDLHFTDRPFPEQRLTCVRCPVRFECLEEALQQESSGTIAGLRSDQVARLRALRRAGGQVYAACAGCGSTFPRLSGGQQYCGPACREAAFRERRRERAVAS